MNPLENIPLNTKKVYVRAITPEGCKVYMPVDSLDDDEQIQKKEELQVYLNTQFKPVPKALA